MIYLLKKTVAVLLSPLIIAVVIGLLAALLKWRGRTRSARVLLGAALAIGYLGSTDLVGNALLRPLEFKYGPVADDAIPGDVRYIVVLGSGYLPRDGIPVTAALSDDALVRVVEGVRLARRLPNAKLILSGGTAPGLPPCAIGYRILAVALGVDEASTLLFTQPRDTAEEAQAVASTLHDEPFLLVTSAYHMPRAMRLMKNAGTRAIPATTAHLVSAGGGWGWRLLLPRASGLSKSEYALHEYVGLAVMSASGKS